MEAESAAEKKPENRGRSVEIRVRKPRETRFRIVEGSLTVLPEVNGI